MKAKNERVLLHLQVNMDTDTKAVTANYDWRARTNGEFLRVMRALSRFQTTIWNKVLVEPIRKEVNDGN